MAEAVRTGPDISRQSGVISLVGDTFRVTDAGFYSSRKAAGARIYHEDDADSRVRFPVQPN